jgi:predicted small lipoprotein YifL
VNRNYRPTFRGWAVIALGVAALALGGCGRKGALDLPPNASQAAVQADAEAEQAAARPGAFNPGSGGDAQPTAPRGRKKAFVLDPLLD